MYLDIIVTIIVVYHGKLNNFFESFTKSYCPQLVLEIHFLNV